MAMTEHATPNGASSPADIAVTVEVVRSGERAAGEGNGEAGFLLASEEGPFVVIDLGCGDGKADDGGSDREAEMCRICCMGDCGGEEGSEMIWLGCGCKGELGVAHRHCAETWFQVKGNRCCEICGATAKNIIAEVERMQAEEGRHGRASGSQNSGEIGERVAWWKSRPFCNFLMACMIVAFMLLWFFRVDIF